MALTDPFPVNPTVSDALDIRLAFHGIFNSPGVVPFSKPNDNAAMPGLVYSSGSMTPAVRDFSLIFARTTSGGAFPDGFSSLRNVGSTSIPAFAAAPASGSRIDRLVVHVNDLTQGDATASPQWLIRAGTATTGDPTTTLGALQTGDIEIAQVLIPAGATALNSSGVVITHVYKAASMMGGVKYCRSVDEINALSAAFSANSKAIDVSTGRQYTWSEVHSEFVLSWVPSVWALQNDTAGNIVFGGGGAVATRTSFTVNAPTRMKARFILRGQVDGQNNASTATTWQLWVGGVQVGQNVRWQNAGGSTPVIMVFELDLVKGSNLIEVKIGTDSASSNFSMNNIRRELYAA